MTLKARNDLGVSGRGIKASGQGQLLNFVDIRTVTENTARGGFVPEVIRR